MVSVEDSPTDGYDSSVDYAALTGKIVAIAAESLNIYDRKQTALDAFFISAEIIR